jgi:hypothetical protein
MNEIKKALDSGMKNIHFNESLVLNKNPKYSGMNGVLKGSAAVAAIALVICMTGIGQTVLAYTYQSIASILGMNKAVEDYTRVIGSSVTDNRITVTLNDVIVSEEKLIVSINISDGQKMKRDEFENRISPGYNFNQINVNNPEDGAIQIYMDGEKIPIAGLSSTGQDIDDYTVNYITEYYIGHIDSEKEHEFKIAMSTIEKPRGSGQKCEEISGKWEFNFEASGADMAKDTKVLMLNDVLKYDDGKIIFEKFVANSYEKILYASTYESSKGKGYGEIGSEVALIGYDDLGNRVSLYAQDDYYNKKGATFICVGGTDISDEASTLTLQAVKNWTDQFNSEKATVTIAIK